MPSEPASFTGDTVLYAVWSDAPAQDRSILLAAVGIVVLMVAVLMCGLVIRAKH